MEEITISSHLRPSATYPKGADLEGAGSTALISTWDLHCPPELTPNEQIAFLLDQLWPRAVTLSKLCLEYKGEVNLASGPGDGLMLDADTLRKLATLNVTLNLFNKEDEFEPAENGSTK